jgi:hypothetical protein
LRSRAPVPPVGGVADGETHARQRVLLTARHGCQWGWGGAAQPPSKGWIGGGRKRKRRGPLLGAAHPTRPLGWGGTAQPPNPTRPLGWGERVQPRGGGESLGVRRRPRSHVKDPGVPSHSRYRVLVDHVGGDPAAGLPLEGTLGTLGAMRRSRRHAARRETGVVQRRETGVVRHAAWVVRQETCGVGMRREACVVRRRGACGDMRHQR